MRKRTLNKLTANEKGQALMLVLILMLLGGLIIAPLLAYMSTGLKTGKEVFEERMYGQYAADAGVEDALYKIRTDDPALPDEWEGMWDASDYQGDPYEYSTPQLNGNNVNVTIQPQWALEGLEDPPQGMTPHVELMVIGDTIGTIDGNGLYQISINYEGSVGEPLKIERIGAWLPAGFLYEEGSSNLEDDTGAKYYSVPAVEDYRGGKAIMWDYSSPYPKFEDLPGTDDKRIVTFQFTPDQSPVSAFSWVVARRQDIYLSWDVDIKLYKITSQATDTDTSKAITVEAYTSKNEMRELGSATSGDYCAVGGTLLEATGSGDDEKYRDWLYMQSNDTIITDVDIPATATVQAAYLYWSGWIDYHYWYWNDPRQRWEWREISELEYPNNPTHSKLIDLVENEAKVNRVLFGSGDPLTEVTADEWQVKENEDQAGTWSYSCFYDATDLVRQFINDNKVDSNGSGTYTVSHAVVEQRLGYPTYSFELEPTSDTTGYPLGTPAHKRPDRNYYEGRYEWAYAGWSLIIIYSSAETKGHQLYLYDDFVYAAENSNVDFNGDGNPGGTIGGFLAPEEIIDELYAAHLTCFVGEGDEVYSGDYIKLNGTSLSNGASPASNVWNSKSPGLAVDGIDIDTFTVVYPTIEPGDTSAQVDLLTEVDSWNLVYIILSFRSEVTTSGTMSYVYVGGG